MIPVRKPWLGEDEARAAGQILSLPMFPGITRGQQERAVDVLQRAVRGRG